MKKLLSAIWAKALAFLLTPLAGVAAVNGVSEVIMVYFYDVWSPHPVWLLVVTVCLFWPAVFVERLQAPRANRRDCLRSCATRPPCGVP